MTTGFPSPAQGYEEKQINLNTLLIKHPNATYFMRIDTTRYARMGIYQNDILIIDRAKTLTPKSLVVYEEDGRFVLGYMYNIKKQTVITGAIVHIIHTVKEQ